MKIKNVVCSLFASVIMWGVSFIIYSNVLNIRELDLKGFILMGLIVVFPLLFLAQGVVVVLTKTNAVVAFLVSTIGYLITMVMFMNLSAIGYVIYFGVFYLVGYGVCRFFVNRK